MLFRANTAAEGSRSVPDDGRAYVKVQPPNRQTLDGTASRLNAAYSGRLLTELSRKHHIP